MHPDLNRFPRNLKLIGFPHTFIQQAFDNAAYSEFLSPHDLVILRCFDGFEIKRDYHVTNFRGVANAEELQLVVEICQGKGKHTVAPNWCI